MVARPKKSEGNADDNLEKSIFDKTNLTNFSDAVIAVAITLLVIELKFPEILDAEFDLMFTDALIGLIAKFIGYVVGFFVIASLWYAYHCNMKYVKRIDGKFVALNTLFIFFIAFLPFPTSILGRYPGHFGSVIFYSGSIILVCIMSALMWAYATRDESLMDKVDGNRAMAMKMKPVYNIIGFLLSIPLAFLNPYLTMAAWGLVILGNNILMKKWYKV